MFMEIIEGFEMTGKIVQEMPEFRKRGGERCEIPKCQVIIGGDIQKSERDILPSFYLRGGASVHEFDRNLAYMTGLPIIPPSDAIVWTGFKIIELPRISHLGSSLNLLASKEVMSFQIRSMDIDRM